MFLHGKVFNTSVDKVVEINAAPWRNFLQFNILPRIALFVCNIGFRAPDRRAIVQNWISPQESEQRLRSRQQKICHLTREASSVRANSFVRTSLKKSKNT
ncbi:MAG: hypothetical protein DMG42_16445 [Acidobacteria bacterium]|nr:MAG: hypothetical protein DMG42_16445 [Acidobacteriota bacterium]